MKNKTEIKNIMLHSYLLGQLDSLESLEDAINSAKKLAKIDSLEITILIKLLKKKIKEKGKKLVYAESC